VGIVSPRHCSTDPLRLANTTLVSRAVNDGAPLLKCVPWLASKLEGERRPDASVFIVAWLWRVSVCRKLTWSYSGVPLGTLPSYISALSALEYVCARKKWRPSSQGLHRPPELQLSLWGL
jgi:hypothetical protein